MLCTLQVYGPKVIPLLSGTKKLEIHWTNKLLIHKYFNNEIAQIINFIMVLLIVNSYCLVLENIIIRVFNIDLYWPSLKKNVSNYKCFM